MYSEQSLFLLFPGKAKVVTAHTGQWNGDDYVETD